MKRTYKAPKLNRYGNVEKITQRLLGRGSDNRGRRALGEDRPGGGGNTGS